MVRFAFHAAIDALSAMFMVAIAREHAAGGGSLTASFIWALGGCAFLGSFLAHISINARTANCVCGHGEEE